MDSTEALELVRRQVVRATALNKTVKQFEESDEALAALRVLTSRVEIWVNALRAIRDHGASLDSDILSVQSIARTVLSDTEER